MKVLADLEITTTITAKVTEASLGLQLMADVSKELGIPVFNAVPTAALSEAVDSLRPDPNVGDCDITVASAGRFTEVSASCDFSASDADAASASAR